MLRRGSLGNLSHGHASGQPAVESGLFSPCGERGTYACWAQCDVYSLVGETKRAGSVGREWCSLSGSRRSEEEASLEDMTWELVGELGSLAVTWGQAVLIRGQLELGCEGKNSENPQHASRGCGKICWEGKAAPWVGMRLGGR